MKQFVKNHPKRKPYKTPQRYNIAHQRPTKVTSDRRVEPAGNTEESSKKMTPKFDRSDPLLKGKIPRTNSVVSGTQSIEGFDSIDHKLMVVQSIGS